MTQSTQISYQAFYDARLKWAGFADMLASTLTSRKAIRASLLPEKVLLETLNGATNAILLQGHWQTPDFQGIPMDEVATKIVLPLLFEISQITLSYDQIFSFGPSYRSIADFFNRNLFTAACRNVPLTLQEASPNDSIKHGTRKLQRQYLFVLKAAFKEPEWDQRGAIEVMDLFLANAYLPVVRFENPILERSGRCLRRASLQSRPDAEIARLEASIMAGRTNMLPHF